MCVQVWCQEVLLTNHEVNVLGPKDLGVGSVALGAVPLGELELVAPNGKDRVGEHPASVQFIDGRTEASDCLARDVDKGEGELEALGQRDNA